MRRRRRYLDRRRRRREERRSFGSGESTTAGVPTHAPTWHVAGRARFRQLCSGGRGCPSSRVYLFVRAPHDTCSFSLAANNVEGRDGGGVNEHVCECECTHGGDRAWFGMISAALQT